jgi:hypothetical protein
MAQLSKQAPLSAHDAAIYFEAVIAAILSTNTSMTADAAIQRYKETLQHLRGKDAFN